MAQRERLRHRLERSHVATLRNWEDHTADHPRQNAVVDCGWGRLIFGQTFNDPRRLADTLRHEQPGRRDIALYLRDPHVTIACAPQSVFLDPSHTFRLWLDRYRPTHRRRRGFIVRLLQSRDDAVAMDAIYRARHMVPPDPDFVLKNRHSRVLTYLVAEEQGTGAILGVVTGVDHREAFDDPENGSSLWALAVATQATQPGIGEALSRQLAEHYLARGRAYMDLSVMHDNVQAIKLYEKLHFRRVPVFALKHKNSYNEPLFIAEAPEAELNPYATIIIREARRRGIGVEVLDADAAYFALSFGGRRLICRESLSELTTAVAMSRCDDKAVTRRVLAQAGLRVPDQLKLVKDDDGTEFLKRHNRVVVKPARGEQGAGISVDIRTPETLAEAVERAREVCDTVLLEEYVAGEDLRIIVIGGEVVAAAVRRPAHITGTGTHTVAQLIEKQSRRRAAATGGESRIPVDAETRRCVEEAGYSFDSVPPAGEFITVRKTANLHTGGTIHDVTPELHPELAKAAVEAAHAIGIPVTGLDFLVPRVNGPDYVIIEANERPGLANHEPQPTAERFIDLLFPLTAKCARN